MANKSYINGIGCVSAQKTFEGAFLDEIINHEDDVVWPVVKPVYQNYIAPAAIRRMSSSVKNSIVSATVALNEAEIHDINAIIVGTGFGCIQDSEKFLKTLIDNDEEYLTPTTFIQSTHNTVAGQIALEQKCKAYNFTYVNSATSFHAALMDGMMQVQLQNINNVLVGGVDEITPYTTKLFQSIGHFKPPKDVQKTDDDGHVLGEGSAFFVLQNEKTANSYCELLDVHFVNKLENSDLTDFVTTFLNNNKLKPADIDLLILGNNGTALDQAAYTRVQKIFAETKVMEYKNIFGEFLTAPAIATWLACNIFKTQEMPAVLEIQKASRRIDYTLIYNHYRNRDHSLILLKNV